MYTWYCSKAVYRCGLFFMDVDGTESVLGPIFLFATRINIFLTPACGWVWT